MRIASRRSVTQWNSLSLWCRSAKSENFIFWRVSFFSGQADVATAVAKSADADADLETAKQLTTTQTGLKRVAAWSAELSKGSKAKNSKTAVAKTEKQLTKADEAYQKALEAETALRSIFKTPSQAEIDALTKEVLGNLINIKEIIQQ